MTAPGSHAEQVARMGVAGRRAVRQIDLARSSGVTFAYRSLSDVTSTCLSPVCLTAVAVDLVTPPCARPFRITKKSSPASPPGWCVGSGVEWATVEELVRPGRWAYREAGVCWFTSGVPARALAEPLN